MWIGGTRPCSTAAQIFGLISLSSVRSWRTAMPVASVKRSETPALRLSTQTPPQARTMISAGVAGYSAASARVSPRLDSPAAAPSPAAPPMNFRREIESPDGFLMMLIVLPS
jgi:hypothetical protein